MLKRIKETLTCNSSGGKSRTTHKLKSHHLLHSDKSTYFYKDKLGKVKSILYSPSIPLLGGIALLLVLGMLICPSSKINGKDKVYADSIIPCLPGAKDLSLTLLDSDTTSLSTEVTANEVGYISQSFQIRTCGYDSYALSAQAAPDYTGRLQGQDNTTEFIEGVGSEVLPTDFVSNQWGYAIADNTSAENSSLKYSTLPESDATTAPAYSEQEMVAGKYFKIVFAAKIGNDKPADHYGTEVLLSLVAEASETTKTWDTIEYMQDMTTSICSDANIGDSKTLTDSRDSSTYTIKKLSDDKCWMTENLRIVNKTITPADSDVTSNYTIPASSSPWSDTAVETNKVHYANNTTHGAYYTWYTATAGTSTSVSTDGQNASSSICPKGWRLPTGNTTGEFQALYNKGSAKVGNLAANSDSGYWFGGTANASGAAFFPAGGYVSNGSLQYAGSEGRYWSSTAYNAPQAYRLYFHSGGVYPSNNGNRYFGYSVRCVAR